MKVTFVSVKPVRSTRFTRLRGYASVELMGEFKIIKLRIIEKSDGRLYVVYPSIPESVYCDICGGKRFPKDRYCPSCGVECTIDMPKTQYREIAFPISGELNRKINVAVVREYNKIVAQERKNGTTHQNKG